MTRANGITDQTIYRWREKYADMSGSEFSELRDLQAEKQPLKRIVARQAPQIDAYKGGGGGKG